MRAIKWRVLNIVNTGVSQMSYKRNAEMKLKNLVPYVSFICDPVRNITVERVTSENPAHFMTQFVTIYASSICRLLIQFKYNKNII